MFTCNGQQFESVAIARMVATLGWMLSPTRCGWMITFVPEVTYDPETGEACFWDDPELPIRECGAELAENADGSWACGAGHEHTAMATRWGQGWDYAEDGYDAAVLGLAGREARPMGPTTFIDPAETAAALATLR